jgi:outer membrane murein-binding lipoprotein Lpp
MGDDTIPPAIANLAATFDPRVTSLDDRATSLATAFDDGMTALETSTRSPRVDLMARMDRLENGMNALHDTIAVTTGASDSVRRSIKNVRDELDNTNNTVFHLSSKIARIETDVRDLKGAA